MKVPFSAAGLEATSELAADGHPVNMTLVFSATQALLTAEAGRDATSRASWAASTTSRSTPKQSCARSSRRCGRAATTAQVLAASIRHPEHVVTAARLGCEVATVPGKVLKQMLEPPAHQRGHRQVRADWKSRPEFAEWLQGLVQAQTTHA